MASQLIHSRDAFPWHRCKPGDSFFVLSLDPKRTAFVGLQAGIRALGRRTPLSARPGIYQGCLGVLFTLPASRQQSSGS